MDFRYYLDLLLAKVGSLVVNLFTGHRSPVILPVIFVTTLECPYIVLIVITLMPTMIERLRAYIRAAAAASSSFIRNNTGIDPAPIARYKLHT